MWSVRGKEISHSPRASRVAIIDSSRICLTRVLQFAQLGPSDAVLMSEAASSVEVPAFLGVAPPADLIGRDRRRRRVSEAKIVSATGDKGLVERSGLTRCLRLRRGRAQMQQLLMMMHSPGHPGPALQPPPPWRPPSLQLHRRPRALSIGPGGTVKLDSSRGLSLALPAPRSV